MDSLTHIIIGAAVAETTIGKKIGNKALVYGAIAGNIPDFDSVFTPLFSPVDALFFHRGISHSFFLLFLLAPVIAYMVGKIDKDSRMRYSNWIWIIALPWLSHLILDIFNTYGTALFEPFSSIRVSYDSVAIVDLLLLAVLIPAFIAIGFIHKSKSSRRVIAWLSIFFVVVYFGLSVIIKENLESKIREEMAHNSANYSRLQTAPLPLSNLIWMVVLEDSSSFDVEQRSILSVDRPFLRNRLAKNYEQLNPIKNSYEIQRLVQFTKGLYTVEKTDHGWLVYDLRYSSLAESYPEAYVFKFDIKKVDDNVLVARTHPKRSLNIKNIKLYFSRLLHN